MSKQIKKINKEIREDLKMRILMAMRSGMGFEVACGSVGVSVVTASGWRKADRFFGQAVKKVRELIARNAIRNGLHLLASGSSLVEERESWSYEDTTRGTVHCSKLVKQVAPSLNAIKMLANKYAQGEYQDAISEVSIKITQRDRSLSNEERLELLASKSLSKEDVEATYKLIENRVKEIDLG